MFSDKRMVVGLLVANAALLIMLVALETAPNRAWAQQAGGSGSPAMAIVVGTPSPSQDEPIFVVDSRNETICVYEFNVGTRKFGLKSARTYKYDKEIEELDNEPPSVPDVKGGRLGRGK